ncbi:hypothetical protein GGX14DRAFT_667709 [Mycena pura]|uniref:dual-specificity kinase n=1 Tax=Mycena pura TaxID=153505 RepID=A0AAD6V554_9AGAR|nr:hypothetical protein GGX14DRAFT_667709 [Mycena pura]
MRCRGVTPRMPLPLHQHDILALRVLEHQDAWMRKYGCTGAPGPRTVQFSINGLKEVKAEAKRNAKNVGRSVSGEGKGSAPKIEAPGQAERSLCARVHATRRPPSPHPSPTLGRKVGLRGLHQRMWTRAQAARGRRRQRAHLHANVALLALRQGAEHARWALARARKWCCAGTHALCAGEVAELGIVEAVVFVIEVRGGVLLDSSNADGERARGYVTVMDIATTFLKCLFDSLEIWTGESEDASSMTESTTACTSPTLGRGLANRVPMPIAVVFSACRKALYPACSPMPEVRTLRWWRQQKDRRRGHLALGRARARQARNAIPPFAFPFPFPPPAPVPAPALARTRSHDPGICVPAAPGLRLWFWPWLSLDVDDVEVHGSESVDDEMAMHASVRGVGQEDTAVPRCRYGRQRGGVSGLRRLRDIGGHTEARRDVRYRTRSPSGVIGGAAHAADGSCGGVNGRRGFDENVHGQWALLQPRHGHKRKGRSGAFTMDECGGFGRVGEYGWQVRSWGGVRVQCGRAQCGECGRGATSVGEMRRGAMTAGMGQCIPARWGGRGQQWVGTGAGGECGAAASASACRRGAASAGSATSLTVQHRCMREGCDAASAGTGQRVQLRCGVRQRGAGGGGQRQRVGSLGTHVRTAASAGAPMSATVRRVWARGGEAQDFQRLRGATVRGGVHELDVPGAGDRDACDRAQTSKSQSRVRPSIIAIVGTLRTRTLVQWLVEICAVGRECSARKVSRKTMTDVMGAHLGAQRRYTRDMAVGSKSTLAAILKGSQSQYLSEYERKEILDYPSTYYVGAKSHKKPAVLDNSANNYGYDDERGDYLVVNHDHLAYRLFGQVLHCRDHCVGESVAIKIIQETVHHQAMVEIKILDNLRKWDPDEKHQVIKMTEHFYFRGHLCIAMELLSINLYELIKANGFVGFTTSLIRRFTSQMLMSLSLMCHHRIVHCDLKPENVLLRHLAKKVIDFGSSCLEHEKIYTYIQSRFYRSPEVILGFPIFPGENEQEQLSCIMEVLGVPDKEFVNRSTRKKLFFDPNGVPQVVINSKGRRRRPGTKSLAQVLRCNDENFVDFISKYLLWDPERRIKPQAALRHPFLTAGKRPKAPGSTTPKATLSSSTLGSSRTMAKQLMKTPKKSLISAPTALTARTTRTTGNGVLTTPSNSSQRSTFGSSRSYRTTQSQSLATYHSSRTLNGIAPVAVHGRNVNKAIYGAGRQCSAKFKLRHWLG